MYHAMPCNVASKAQYHAFITKDPKRNDRKCSLAKYETALRRLAIPCAKTLYMRPIKTGYLLHKLEPHQIHALSPPSLPQCRQGTPCKDRQPDQKGKLCFYVREGQSGFAFLQNVPLHIPRLVSLGDV
jgi:hypothetical protein